MKSISRRQLIAALADFAGPLGPLESIEEQEHRRQRWIAAVDDSLIDAILDVIVHPPDDAEYAPATHDNFEIELRQMLEIVAGRDPRGTVAALGHWLGDRNARPILVEAIGGIGVPEGLRWLAPLVGDTSLSEDEAIRLACALGEIGGDDARALLEKLRASTPDDWQAVKAEIEIAFDTMTTARA